MIFTTLTVVVLINVVIVILPVIIVVVVVGNFRAVVVVILSVIVVGESIVVDVNFTVLVDVLGIAVVKEYVAVIFDGPHDNVIAKTVKQ